MADSKAEALWRKALERKAAAQPMAARKEEEKSGDKSRPFGVTAPSGPYSSPTAS